MPVDRIIQSFQSGLGKVRNALSSDLGKIVNELDASENVVNKVADPVTVWTAGSSIGSIQPEKVSDMSVKSIMEMMREAVDTRAPVTESAIDNNNQPSKKTVSFNPQVKSVSFKKDSTKANADAPAASRELKDNVPATPQTATKVRSMLSVWEEKIQRVTTPHYGKTPMSCGGPELSSCAKRKIPEPSEDHDMEKPSLDMIPETDALFDGPILEIPDDLLAELEGLEPKQREKRLSEIQMAVEEKRRSVAPAEPVAPLAGRVAAALKLFTGTSVPKRDFGVVSFAPSRSYQTKPTTNGIPIDQLMTDLDGEAIDHKPVAEAPIKFYDAREKGVLDVEFAEESEPEEMNDPERSILHAVEAAKEVAEEEAAVEELEKSVWLADIEEIKIVSTPAKGGKSEATADWSAVSQRMNLSCHLTPVVPGRRSCVVVKPKMLPLGPKTVIDQYEITDKDTDSENELSPASRAKKHVPSWCVNWRQKAIAQIAVDPESIFGVTVPKCDLDVIFTEKNYRDMGLSRPKRVRGSSGNWTFDKLTQDEVDRYRAKLGQVVKADGVFVDQ
jgi:hypothetical protein